MTDFLIYDVFTDSAFGGNPLAVIPDATGLPEALLQSLAREFNFSETTFVFPPENPAHTAKVRIFTPTRELQFAGHPIVGTAVALSRLRGGQRHIVLELGVGPIPVTLNADYARFETRVPLSVSDAPSAAVIAQCVGIPADAVRTDRHAPISAGLGADFVLAELTDQNALAKADGAMDAFRRAADGGRLALYVYVREGSRIRARMFAPLGGTQEDPATGSAAAALAAWLGQLDGASASFDITQGVEMGRPSKIEASVTVKNGRPTAVTIGGRAIKVMEGRLAI